ncbi:hypothetical protein [Nostoc sp. NMS4]|uniref:hypothetical protein n=1 Tax=Nostoc sp. NMS4 TaxID=2815390 RepID=UPI0025CEC12B|nr:hypothetical protein [Nostoc sp. NMS4]MBN3926115.1 hypothetical protein [Nostoc sp. NMS4]
MSTSSVIGSMQSALNCAGKCDCCNKLQQQIDFINAKLAGLKNIDENAIIQKSVARSEASIIPQIPGIAEGVATAIASGLIAPLRPKIQNAVDTASEAIGLAKSAESSASSAISRATVADLKAAQAVRDAEIATFRANVASGVATEAERRAVAAYDKAIGAESSAARAIGEAGKAVTEAQGATAKAVSATNTALEANSAVGGLKGVVEGLKGRVGALAEGIAKVENIAGQALVKAAAAVGISQQALEGIGRLAGRIAEIFQIIGTLATLVEQLATLNTLGGRIDAVERGLEALGASVSGILGKLLGLQNRIGRNESSIAEVRNIAIDAKGIGEAANLKAGAAQVTSARAQGIAESALGTAKQAQLTADGAVRNAAIANQNASTAYQKATQAEGLGEQAKRIAGEALGKAGVALTTALTAIALYQTVKGLRGLQGIPGIPGRQGERGLQGIPGIPGRDGITTVVQVPGVPGRQGERGLPGISGLPGRAGRDGLPGKDGRNGIDVSPAEAASLRALIIQQHTQTRLNSTSQHSATRTTILTPIMAALAPILALLKQIYDAVIAVSNAAILALLNVINTKLGAQVTGGLSQFIETIAKNTYIEKALAVLTFATTVHNALLLSSNLGQTLFMIIDQVLATILPKGLDGNPISIGNVLGKAVHEVLNDIIGVTATAQVQQTWDQCNRIYQAALNIHNQVLGLGGVLTAGMEVVGGNIGKIGNALRKGGVLLEDAYTWMNPQPNLKGKFFQRMNLVGDNLAAIALVTAIPAALIEAKNGVDNSVADLKREIGQKDPTDANGNPMHNADGSVIHYQPGLEVPTPIVQAAAGDQAKADSTNFLQLALEDILDGGD